LIRGFALRDPMTDDMNTLAVVAVDADPANPKADTAALRAHIRLILRKVAPAKPRPGTL
jgi:hypothetical protein